MNNDENKTKSNLMFIDEEQLKDVSGLIKKNLNDLNIIKKHADVIWKECSMSLDENVIANIDSIKEINNKKYNKAVENIETYANKMETISNIWKEVNIEIKNSSKKLEDVFTNISKTFQIEIDKSKKE